MSLTTKFVKNLKRFNLVTFDVTDTLLRFRYPPEIQYAETAASHGYPGISKTKISHDFRSNFKYMMKNHPNYGRETPNMTWKQWWIMLVMNVFKSVSPSMPEKDMLAIAEELVEIYHSDKGFLHVDGAIEILSKVKESGKIVGVISNFDTSLPQILNVMNLNVFDFVITAYDCGILKPNKRIFDLALSKSNVTHNQALHIGNMYELDYIGAKGAGWSSLLISQMTEKDIKAKQIDKQHVYQSLVQLIHALEHDEIKW